MPVDTGTLDRALASIRKTYGDGSIHKASEKPVLRRIPTGSIELDYAIGGGVPLGRWCHWYGGRSSGKTLAAYNTIAAAQAMGLTVAYYNIEKQFDPVWAAKHGIDTDALELVEGTIIEQVGAKLETLLGSVHVHVLDSIAMAISQDELATKAEEWRPGISARAWGKVLRRCNERFDDQENTVILINQTRKTFGYGGGDEATGGVAIEYISRLSLLFRRSSWLFYNKDDVLDPDAPSGDSLTGDKEPDGIEIQVRVAKTNGFGQMDRTARLRLDYKTGQYDDLWTMTKAAVHLGIVQQAGAWYTYGKQKMQGKTGLRELIAGDEKLREKIMTKLMEGA